MYKQDRIHLFWCVVLALAMFVASGYTANLADITPIPENKTLPFLGLFWFLTSMMTGVASLLAAVTAACIACGYSPVKRD